MNLAKIITNYNTTPSVMTDGFLKSDFLNKSFSDLEFDFSDNEFFLELTDEENQLCDKAESISPNFNRAFFFAMRGVAVFPADGYHTIEDATTDFSKLAGMWIKSPNARPAIATGHRFGIVAIDYDVFIRLMLEACNLKAPCNFPIARQEFNTWRMTILSSRWIEREDYFEKITPLLEQTAKNRNQKGLATIWESITAKRAEYGEDKELLFFRVEQRDDLNLASFDGFYGDDAYIVDEDNGFWLFSSHSLENENNPPKQLPQKILSYLTNTPTKTVVDDYAEVDDKKIEVKSDVIESRELAKPSNQQFPQMDKQAFYGLAGDLVRLIEPHSEADPVALLAQTLVAFGSMIGRNAHTVAEADLHYTNLNIVLVGESSKARKGTSWGQVRTRLETIDSTWKERIMSGLSSGEGMIWQVRDEIKKREKKVEKGVVTYEEVVADPGIDDKRLTIFEGEFANVLNMLQREGNSLSALIRNAWDTGNLSTLVKNAPAKATDAHISIIGHITRDELLRKLQATEQANGFANRFLWLSVKRSKMLPLGGKLHTVDFANVIARLGKATEIAYGIGEMEFDNEATQLWCDIYPVLSEGKAGMLGAITSRGEAQTKRLSSVYALLDSSRIIRREHLEAALAFWKYAEDSAAFIFGNALGDPVADEIMRSLHETKETGLTRTQIRDLFNRHNVSDVQRALNSLIQRGLVRVEKEETGGRPSERFFCVNGV